MELTFAQQSTAFLWSIILGIALGVVYGVFRFIRTALDFRKAATVISDIIYMLTVFSAIFFFSIAYLMGYIRVYVFIGAVVGFLAYRVSIGQLISKIYSPVILFLRKFSKNIHLKIKKIAKKLLKNIYNILYNDINKRRIFGSKPKNTVSDKRVMDSDEEKTATSGQSSGSSESRK